MSASLRMKWSNKWQYMYKLVNLIDYSFVHKREHQSRQIFGILYQNPNTDKLGSNFQMHFIVPSFRVLILFFWLNLSLILTYFFQQGHDKIWMVSTLDNVHIWEASILCTYLGYFPPPFSPLLAKTSNNCQHKHKFTSGLYSSGGRGIIVRWMDHTDTPQMNKTFLFADLCPWLSETTVDFRQTFRVTLKFGTWIAKRLGSIFAPSLTQSYHTCISHFI